MLGGSDGETEWFRNPRLAHVNAASKCSSSVVTANRRTCSSYDTVVTYAHRMQQSLGQA